MLDGKTALVTGGTRGIGRAISEHFLAHGANVVINGRNADLGEQTTKELEAGKRALFVEADVTNTNDVTRMVDATIDHYGRIDVLVNNAGGMPSFGLVATTSDETWHQNLELNLHSVFYVTREVLKHMTNQGVGRIVNISSILGKQGDAGLSAYAAAKHAVIGLTQSLAREVGQHGITANCICPGIVMTDMIHDQAPHAAEVLGVTYEQIIGTFTGRTAIGRATLPDEVAATAVLLASETGAGISGSAFSVDGGSTGT